MKRLTHLFAAAVIVSGLTLAPVADSEAWFNMNGPWNNGSGWGAAARGIMAMAVDPGAVARGIVAMVVVPGAAAHHGIAAGAVDLTGVVVECRGTAVMVEIATTVAVLLTTVAVLLTTVATTVAAAPLLRRIPELRWRCTRSCSCTGT